jgi:hypothetical protein
MVTTRVGVLLTVEAKPGLEGEVANLLGGSLPIVEAEPDTVAWFAMRLGPRTFGLFDAFAQEDGRRAHLSGEVPKALDEHADLFAGAPQIKMVQVLATKLP